MKIKRYVYCIFCVLSREITRLATLWQSECRTRGRTSVILTNERDSRRNPLHGPSSRIRHTDLPIQSATTLASKPSTDARLLNENSLVPG